MTENEYAYELRLLAERFPPLEYHLVDVDGGPSAVIAAYEKGESIPVYTGDSENTIWGEPEMNWLFRAHHDSIHLRYDVPFTQLGEYITAEISSALAEIMGFKALAFAIRADVAGFAAYQADNNKFAPQGLSKTLMDTVRVAVEGEKYRTAK